MRTYHDETLPTTRAEAVKTAAAALRNLSGPIEEFRTESDAGELSIIRDDVNVMQERADAAKAALVAAAQIRHQLMRLESDAHEVIERADARRSEIAEHFFEGDDTA